MRTSQDQMLHQLSVETVIEILEQDAWKANNQTQHQSVSSAITNTNDLKKPNPTWINAKENTAGPNAFADVKFDPHVKRILDVGGGKFDHSHNYLKEERGIILLVWDPYNRSASHNAAIQYEVQKTKVDAVASMSVLNVIPELAVRLTHLSLLKFVLPVGGKAYFKIWPGPFPLKGTYLPVAYDDYFQSNAGPDRFYREVETIFGLGNVVIDREIPNLMIAEKKSENRTPIKDILFIQSQSAKEAKHLKKFRKAIVAKFYAATNLIRLFSLANDHFIKKMEDDFLETNRHNNAKIQEEYDKKYGLIIL